MCLNFGDQHVKNHKLAVKDECTIVACNLGFLRINHYKNKKIATTASKYNAQ